MLLESVVECEVPSLSPVEDFARQRIGRPCCTYDGVSEVLSVPRMEMHVFNNSCENACDQTLSIALSRGMLVVLIMVRTGFAMELFS